MISVTRTVMWGQLDALEHVNNTVYLQWFEEARIEVLAQVGLRAQRTQTGVGPILAATSCQFLVPLGHPDVVEVACWVERIGNTSFTLGYEVRSQALGVLAARGDSVVVNYDYGARQKCSISEAVRVKLRALVR